ncbi:MAG TPA: threonine--tRNA ligase [archaeon]|nr:threonine--tRNA ligase [archaeon]
MRILQLHADFIEYEPVKKEIRQAEEAEKKKYKLEEIVVLFTAVEENDNEGSAKKAISEVKEFLQNLKVNRILIYPYAHLSSNLAKPDVALKIVKEMENCAKILEIETYRAPFGWTKRFSISIKGHPLAEQSREILPSGKSGKKEEVAKPSIKKEYLILDKDGKTYSPKDYKFKKGEEDFKFLVEKEALGIESKGGKEPEYIKHCKKFGIELEPMSDVGHMRYNPIGDLIYKLVAEHSQKAATSIGIPVYVVHGTNMFNLDFQPVREHAQLFGDRLYTVEVENKKFIMRYAACHQQFAMIKDWQISYKHMPFGAFEIADSYRLEQSGEALFLFRLRRFDMPDLHVFCGDIEESKKWFFVLHERIYDEIKDLKRDYVSLYNLTSKEFFEKNKEWFMKLVKFEGKPVLLCFYPQGINYYWVLNIEYHIIDEMKRPREIATVQIDVGNSKRFGIKFADKNGKEVNPLILHSAIIGGIERYLYTIFDTALKMKNPALPLWLTPTQVRIVPISDKFNEDADRIAKEIEKSQIRVDIDDRRETVDKKIRDAEVEWAPFSVVIGPKEIESKKLAVRIRETGKVEQMKVEELVERIRKEIENKPFRQLPLPKLLSRRPIFSS